MASAARSVGGRSLGRRLVGPGPRRRHVADHVEPILDAPGIQSPLNLVRDASVRAEEIDDGLRTVAEVDLAVGDGDGRLRTEVGRDDVTRLRSAFSRVLRL